MPRKDIAKDGKKYQFKKGQSGNPGGNVKGVPHIATMIKRLGMEVAEGTKDKTYLEMVIRNAWIAAMEGDDKSREFLFNRAFGKVTDKVAFTDSEGKDRTDIPNVPVMVFGSIDEAVAFRDKAAKKEHGE